MTRNNGKIKVLHILPFLNKGGGTERIVYDLLSRINPMVFDRKICVTHKPADDFQAVRFNTAGIDVYELPKKENRRDRFIGLFKHLRANDFNIAHVHTYDGNENHARFACVLARVPAIITHDHRYAYWNDRPVLNVIWSLLNLFTYRNIAASETCGDFRRKCCLWQKDKVIIINNGVALDLFRPPSYAEKRGLKASIGINPDAFVIGAVGRLVEVKQFGLFIQAAAHFRHNKNLVFILAGEGPLERELKGMAKKNKLENIHFLSWREEIAKIFKCMDVFVMSSEFHEGFGLVTAEAMASGIPIVALNSPNHVKVVTPECGVFVGSTPSDIAEGIKRIMLDKDLALRLSIKARQRAIDFFDINRAVKELEELYLCATR